MSHYPTNTSLPVGQQPFLGSLSEQSGISDAAVVQGTFALHDRVGQQIKVWQDKPQRSLMSFIREDPLEKVLGQARAAQVEQQLIAQGKAFALATESKLALVEANCETLIRETNVRHGVRVSQMILTGCEQLLTTVHATRDTFMARAAESYEQAQKYAHIPFMAERAMKSLEAEVNSFHAYLDATTEEFFARARRRLTEWNQSPATTEAIPTANTNANAWNI